MLLFSKEKIKPQNRFIDLNDKFHETKLIGAGINPKDKKLCLGWQNQFNQLITKDIHTYEGKLFPDLESPSFSFNDDFSKLKKLFFISKKEIFQKIYTCPYNKLKIEELLLFLEHSFDISKDIGTAFIKLHIAKGFLEYKEQKTGAFIKLSELVQSIEDKKRFLQAISDEIISQSNRIELLIKHNQTKGNYRELLLRKVLQKYIPKKYKVATGFIEGCKRQCDIIIYDAFNYSPLFKEDDLVVVPPKSVRAIIEVKTTLTSDKLKEALEILEEISAFTNTPAPVFKGIFAFKKGIKDVSNIAKNIFNFYHSETTLSHPLTREIHYLYETVNSICVQNEQTIITDIIDYEFKDDSIRPRIYSLHPKNKELNIYSAYFFSELFAFLEVEKHAKKVNSTYFHQLGKEVDIRTELNLYEKGWFPKYCFKNEHSFEKESIWKRASDVTNWKIGNISTQELEEIYFDSLYKVLDLKEVFKTNGS